MPFEPVVPNPDLSILENPPAPWDRVAVACRWKDGHTFRRRWPLASVVGPLRTVRGIDHLVRNLLANPQIRTVVVDGPDLTAGERTTAVLQLVWFGGPAARRGLLSPDLPEELVAQLVAEVRLVGGIKPDEFGLETIALVDRPSGRHVLPPPPPAATASAPMGDPGQRVVGETLSEVWPLALAEVLHFGIESGSKYGQTKEVLGLVSVIRNPRETVSEIRDPKTRTSYRMTAEDLDEYVRRFSTDYAPTSDMYSYGSRMADQFPRFESELARAPDERGLFLTPWRPEDQTKPGGRPCLVGVQFRLLGGRLHVVAVFRSHDLFEGYPSNLAALCAWLVGVADRHGHAVGTVEVLSVSAHAYDRDWNAARSIVEDWKPLIRWDGRTTWQVDVVDGAIRALALTPDGTEIVEVFEGADAQTLRRRIDFSGLLTSTGNALWLGAELAAAEARLLD